MVNQNAADYVPCRSCGGWGGENLRSRLNPNYTPCGDCGGTGEARQIDGSGASDG